MKIFLNTCVRKQKSIFFSIGIDNQNNFGIKTWFDAANRKQNLVLVRWKFEIFIKFVFWKITFGTRLFAIWNFRVHVNFRVRYNIETVARRRIFFCRFVGNLIIYNFDYNSFYCKFNQKRVILQKPMYLKFWTFIWTKFTKKINYN